MKLEEFLNGKNVEIYFNEKLKECKTYKKQLTIIKQQRQSRIQSLGLYKYTELCNDNIKQISEIFINKGFKGKKLENIIQKSLNPLDSRLTKYGKYYDNCIDIDEINVLKDTLNIWRKERTHYEVFDFSEICTGLNNYGTIISKVEEIIKINIVDKNKFNNIIYVEFSSTNKDPYSFYLLCKTENNKKYWKMDCRLEDFSLNLREYLFEYLIRNFRSMYHDVFSDNDYRKNYKDHCQFTECDMGLLYNNILTLSNFTMFNRIIKDIVKNNCNYKPSDNDILNVTKDDPLRDINYCKNLNITEDEIHKRIFE